MAPRANKRNNCSFYSNRKKQRQWNAHEKIAILMYHEKGNSKNKTACKYNIQTKQLYDWISKKSQLLRIK